MKVLVVDEEIPFPLNSGKRIRTYNLLAPLAKEHQIVFLCRCHEGAQNDLEGFERCGIRAVVVPDPVRRKSGPGFYAALGLNLVSRYPYVVTSHHSRTLEDTLVSLLDRSHFDLVHCEWLPYLINIPYRDVPVVVDMHNVESVIWRRNYLNETNLVRKWYVYLQWKKMEEFERSSLRRASEVITVSENDREAVCRSNTRCSVIDNGVDVDYFVASCSEAVPYSLVFCGGLDWRPNADGVVWFLQKVWPIVVGKYPQATLALVGRDPLPIVREHAQGRRGVTLTGTVDDVRPYVWRSSVVVVPLRIGSGSRLKILEALSMAKPVVSTSIGAEGLRVSNEKEILLADDPRRFAECIFRLFENDTFKSRLGLAGQDFVTRRHQWKTLSGKLEHLWQGVSNSGNVQ